MVLLESYAMLPRVVIGVPVRILFKGLRLFGREVTLHPWSGFLDRAATKLSLTYPSTKLS